MTEQKFELTLKLNGYIICQRYFKVKEFAGHINYSNIDKCMNNITDDIINDLDIKDSKYPKNPRIQESNESYSLELTKDDEVLFERFFPAGKYFRKVRYRVNIKPKVREYLKNLTEIL